MKGGGSGEAPNYHTGVIWGVLGLLLVLGTVASATTVYAFLGLVSSNQYLLDGLLFVVAAGASVFLIMLIAGILYRIDRLRGVPHRRVELFE